VIARRRGAAAALLLVALAAGCGRDRSRSAENLAREAFVKDLAAREGLTARWRLMSRGDLVFEDGWGPLVLLEPGPDPKAVAGPPASPAAVPARWIARSAHLRLAGGGDRTLRVWGRVEVAKIFTRPRVSLTVAGREVASRLVEPDGSFALEVVIPARAAGWIDGYLRLSSAGDVEREPARLRVARVEGVTWEPAR